jgi:predicted alpha/beta hydrolase family esterase
VTVKRVIILHGTGGSPEGNWFPWLAAQVKGKGREAFAPAFPTPQNQSYKSWRAIFDSQVSPLHANDALVGHSLGSVFALRMLVESALPIGALYLAAPFAAAIGRPDYDDLNRSFWNYDFDWKALRRKATKIFCYAGGDDPYVPLRLSSVVAKNLGGDLRIIPNGGHLNAESGYREFPALWQDLSPLL